MEPGRRFSRTMSGRKATAHFFCCRQGRFEIMREGREKRGRHHSLAQRKKKYEENSGPDKKRAEENRDRENQPDLPAKQKNERRNSDADHFGRKGV